MPETLTKLNNLYKRVRASARIVPRVHCIQAGVQRRDWDLKTKQFCGSKTSTSEGSREVAADGAAPGPERGGPGPAAPAPQTLLARCVLSAAGYIAGVGTIVD